MDSTLLMPPGGVMPGVNAGDLLATKFFTIGFAKQRSVEEKRKKVKSSCGIFSNPDILNAVHSFEFYKDSKDFVDSPLKASPAEALEYFANHVHPADEASVREFLTLFFDAPGSALVPHEPEDWQPHPPRIEAIQNSEFKAWATKLNELWKILCRKMKDEVHHQQDRYSLFFVPHSFVIPGGRFREFYYWDTFWIIRGLLVSNMFETAKSMIHNLAYVVERLGFIPNGGRTYYLNRSQPPMFIPIVYEYFLATGDTELVTEMLPFLQGEYDWWYKNRTVSFSMPNSKSFTMLQYRAATTSPRPESFKEDIKTASCVESGSEKALLYRNIASACESGMDFSSRWFEDGRNLKTCITTSLVPADLNALMCYNTGLLAELYTAVGDADTAQAYSTRHAVMLTEFQEVFWHEAKGSWFDYNVETLTQNSALFCSANIATCAFTKCYTSPDQLQRAYIYFRDSVGQSSCVPTSVVNTGEQWDFPNAWAPHVHMLVMGLWQSGIDELQQAALKLAEQWISLNYEFFRKTGSMFEKYDVSSSGTVATGGEYEVQTGFGWTNGVVLDFLTTFNFAYKTS